MTDTRFAIADLLQEYDRALRHTDDLWRDLTVDEVHWRPDEQASAIGWHLGHQAAVAHFMVRNLTAAEPSPDPALDALMDSATPEPARGDLPGLDRILAYRTSVAERTRFRIGAIERGDVGAPAQLAHIAVGLMVAVINHEYQHSKWIGEVRTGQFGHALPDLPESDLLVVLDGYPVVA
ncbi:MAG: DinB family protein [Ilumatobacter sp.]